MRAPRSAWSGRSRPPRRGALALPAGLLVAALFIAHGSNQRFGVRRRACARQVRRAASCRADRHADLRRARRRARLGRDQPDQERPVTDRRPRRPEGRSCPDRGGALARPADVHRARASGAGSAREPSPAMRGRAREARAPTWPRTPSTRCAPVPSPPAAWSPRSPCSSPAQPLMDLGGQAGRGDRSAKRRAKARAEIENQGYGDSRMTDPRSSDAYAPAAGRRRGSAPSTPTTARGAASPMPAAKPSTPSPKRP